MFRSFLDHLQVNIFQQKVQSVRTGTSDCWLLDEATETSLSQNTLKLHFHRTRICLLVHNVVILLTELCLFCAERAAAVRFGTSTNS